MLRDQTGLAVTPGLWSSIQTLAPLIAMFVVNGITGKVEDGTWALLIGTLLVTLIAVLTLVPVLGGKLTYPAVGEALGLPFEDPYGVWGRQGG